MATVHLQVSLLDEADPHFAASRVGTQPVAILINWQVVVNHDTSPGAIDEKLDDILTSWIVDRIAIVILRKDILRNDALLPSCFHLKVACDC